ncbi:UDP-N-acetylmuramate dehydrogenase [Vreelandella subglaciescola]|jgi:UDP-N-acetylmuramate dehydrogenase|uniref:UDP-N-acetylenolpyruvoylglucosamine reductase n=1 Tax=Vreelandella subglaciescola TaxID=29571 RepID=A0A1M7F1L8_9GAMM|nr:UDP-N-acetylmuramate dehydrogenase [Halomonas subglaciescola]SHL97607.1 UDP-N-acetylmuramate dehydrogenase [Halomonas subglaciescola]
MPLPEPTPWQRYCDLTDLNTLRLPSRAQFFAAPTTLSALRGCIARARREGRRITLLGGGSNVLLPSTLGGVVVRPALGQWWLERDGKRTRAYVGSGVNWHALVMALAARGLWGSENLALIPGDCGAAPVQNIGAYGVELADVLAGVQVMSLADGQTRWLSRRECRFGYRDSVFKHELAGKVAITRLVLELSREPRPVLGYGDLAARTGDAPSALDVAQTVSAIRREKLPDPQRLPNAGSFFKNPVIDAAAAQRLLEKHPDMPQFPQASGGCKLAAGWLIDRCGLKGQRFGAFGVHERQALVLVHFGGGDRAGLKRAADQVAGAVMERFGVALEVEPRTIQA